MIIIVPESCNHQGWALYTDSSRWWCGQCGDSGFDISVVTNQRPPHNMGDRATYSKLDLMRDDDPERMEQEHGEEPDE